MIKENQKNLNRMLTFIDVFIIFISLILAWYIRFRSGFIEYEGGMLSFREYIRPIVFIIPLYLFLYGKFNLYNTYRIKSVWDEFFNIFRANLFGILLFTLMLYVMKNINYSRYLLFIFAITCTVLTTIERVFIRYILRKARRKGYNLKHILLVGYSKLAMDFLGLVSANRQWGYNIVGILDDNKKSGYRFKGKEIIGKIRDLENILEDFEIDEVCVTLELKEYDKLGHIINECEKAGVRTQIIPDYVKYIPAKPYVEEVGGLPIINIRYVPLDNIANKFVKRLFDIVGSLISIIVFSPVMILASIIIKITSPGPIIFKQERVGLNRKPFVMYKFRSMKVQKDEEEKGQWTTEDDPRKTRFGNFIRKTSIDELPQLFNVLKGDMSLVGPRPERPFFVGQFREEIPRYMVKHQVRPGMTGWAQVNGLRGDTSIKDRIEHDLYYIENWSFGFDIKIMWFTVFKGFINKNAY